MERKLVGELTPEELTANNDLRKQANDAVRQLGEVFLRGIRIAMSVFEAEAQHQSMYREIAQRFDINQDQQWQVLPDGRVYTLMAPDAPAEETQPPVEEAN